MKCSAVSSELRSAFVHVKFQMRSIHYDKSEKFLSRFLRIFVRRFMLLHAFAHFGVNNNFAQNFCALWTRFCSLSSHFCKKCILSGINFRAKLTLSAFLHAFNSLLPHAKFREF